MREVCDQSMCLNMQEMFEEKYDNKEAKEHFERFREKISDQECCMDKLCMPLLNIIVKV